MLLILRSSVANIGLQLTKELTMKTNSRLSWLAVVAAATAVCGVALAYVPAGAAIPSASSGAAWSTALDGSDAGVVIDDITIDVPHAPPVAAYVVRPAGHLAPQSQAGILFLHWLGQIHNDRTEYLPE